jgi:UDP-N-acetyl-2-amino-2-deoxyglucuronate dehydrogenase
MYRIAILGCRGRGTSAARAYHMHPSCQIVGICDLLPERLQTLGDELQVSARFADLDQMVKDTQPDIVAIPTATEFHYDLCMRILEYGIHIEVEKPMCATLDQADNLVRRAREQGVRIAVHHQGRCGASMRAVSVAIKEGRIGELRHLIASGKGYYGGYGLMNIGTHLVNNMLHLAGNCRSISAIARTDGRPVEPEDVIQSPSGMGTICGESITATLHFDKNVTGTLLHHRFPQVDSTAYGIEVIGSEGRLFWKSNAAWHLPNPHYVPDGINDQWTTIPLSYPDDFNTNGTANEADFAFVDEFVSALDHKREHLCSGVAGRHAMEVLMGVFESAAYGKRIGLPQEDRSHPLLRWRKENELDDPEPLPRDLFQWIAVEDQRLGRTTADQRE